MHPVYFKGGREKIQPSLEGFYCCYSPSPSDFASQNRDFAEASGLKVHLGVVSASRSDDGRSRMVPPVGFEPTRPCMAKGF